MADVQVHIVNKSGQKVALTVDEDGDMLAHFKKMLKADEFESVSVKPVPKPKQS